MISVCIPTYCYDTRKLAETLYREGQRLGIFIEIIVIDDGSPLEWQQLNSSVEGIAQYVALPANVGRASVRNLFLKYARFEWLLFLDSDVMPSHDKFIKQYVEAIVEHPNVEVICGGLQMPPRPAEASRQLRWYYGVKRECRSVSERNLHPYQSFMTGNFCIRRSTLERFPFDEGLRQYGHEDTLLGFRLMQNHVPILHIDNPVIHLHLEEAEIFLEKTERAVANLYYIATNILQNDYLFVSQNKLLRIAFYLKRYRLIAFCRIIFLTFRFPLRKLLLQYKPVLLIFDLYKLGTLCKIIQ